MSDDRAVRRRFNGRLGLAGVLAGVGAAALVVTGVGERDRSSARLQEWTEAQAMPTVAIVALNPKPGVTSLNLPGRLEAESAGADLRAGQRLREGLEGRYRRLRQGRADARRDRGARPRPAVAAGARRSFQRRGQRPARGGHAGARAQPAGFERRFAAGSRPALGRPRQQAGRGPAGEAAVERLEVLAGYKKVAAPFDGVVTERNTDVGALISAGSSAGLHRCSSSRTRTSFASPSTVPQSYAPAIRIGDKAIVRRARISRPDLPRRRRGLRALGRYRLRHDAHAADGGQRQRRTDAGRLRHRARRSRRRGRIVPHPRQRASSSIRPGCGSRRSIPTTGSCSRG